MEVGALVFCAQLLLSLLSVGLCVGVPGCVTERLFEVFAFATVFAIAILSKSSPTAVKRGESILQNMFLGLPFLLSHFVRTLVGLTKLLILGFVFL